ncbi:serum response factor-binding protein 1 [Paramormyrops kingsleyae]|uniref:Serum response factor-binding protein 1 n=1 Tax=Paramormyrops kingsleyae TaxID=1676925 RepID=A0A3B3QT22_9TELE|nr:serum response factor-binding protein 1 [Paramormyrops kingsleyae]
MAGELNLNNEVVRMRKEIKKVRALIIRKITRQITSLKNKKGTEAEVQKNQRRVARLQEEISKMKTLKPDYVTKLALQKNLSFEKVCKDTKLTLEDRAIARIATHPHINKKIVDIKAAIKAFQNERKKPSEAKKTQASVKPIKDPRTPGSLTKNISDKEQHNSAAVKCQDITDKPSDRTTSFLELLPHKTENLTTLEGSNVETQPERNVETDSNQENTSKSIQSTMTLLKADTNSKGGMKEPAKKRQKSTSCATEQKKKDVEESDLDQSDEDEEKEYFDDSTEERFHKQSSQSEDSDDDDDFFLGKISKLRKKKPESGLGESSKKAATSAAEPEMEAKEQTCGEKDGQASRAMKLQSAFCNRLSGSAGTSSKGPGGKSKPSKFQKTMAPTGGNSKLSRPENQKGGPDKRSLPSRHVSKDNGGRRGSLRPWDKGPGPGKERPKFQKQMQGRSWATTVPHPSQNAPQTLHPSWEASKRRREQQAQITAFQGKKIKFDD